MTKQEMLSTVENRMLAFWGYENTKISSVGLVMQNQTCIKGVTTKTMPDPPKKPQNPKTPKYILTNFIYIFKFIIMVERLDLKDIVDL